MEINRHLIIKKSIILLVFSVVVIFGCASKPTQEQKLNVDFNKLYGEWITVDYYYDKKITNVDTIKDKPIKIKLGTMFVRFNKDGTYFEQTCTITKGRFVLDRKKYSLNQFFEADNKQVKVKEKIIFLDDDCLLLSLDNRIQFLKRYIPKTNSPTKTTNGHSKNI